MREVRKKSVVPIYAVGLVWVLFALFFPLYSLFHFLLVIAVSVIVYFLASKIFRGKVIKVPIEPVVKEEPVDTELEAVLKEGKLAISEMGRLYASIPDADVKHKIMEIMNISEKIINNAREDKNDIPRIMKFLSYYLPTTIKLLNTYDRMYMQGIEGENISGTMSRIEDMLDTVVVSYKKQLDALFADEALDIETDIKVMDGMLQREGLKEKEF